MRRAHVYILTNRRNGALYIGVTTNLAQRLIQHRACVDPAFTSRYNIVLCVLVEEFASIRDARARERQLKHWRRSWKLALIQERNPYWHDLSFRIPLT